MEVLQDDAAPWVNMSAEDAADLTPVGQAKLEVLRGLSHLADLVRLRSRLSLAPTRVNHNTIVHQ